MVSQNSIDDTIEENNFSVNRSGAGVTVVSSVNHSDNSNTDSNAQQLIKSGGASGGDPYTRYLISGTQEFSVGIDNTDSDKLKIGPNAHPSTGIASISVKPAGDITFYGAYEFPTTDGSAGQTLVTDGTGNIDWGSTAGSGEVLQVIYAQTSTVSTISSVIPIDGTIPQKTEGVQVLTANITPQRATSKLLISFSLFADVDVSGVPVPRDTAVAALFRDAVTPAFYATVFVAHHSGTGARGGGATTGIVQINALSTSSTTIKLRVGRGAGPAGSVLVNSFTGLGGANNFGGVQLTTMTITEIAV